MNSKPSFSDLILHYQPIVNPRTSEVFGFEALCRLAPPRQQLIMPSVFMANMSVTDLEKLDFMVLSKAVANIASIQSNNSVSNLFINLNGVFSLSRIRIDRLIRYLEKACKDDIVKAESLVFEVSEQTAYKCEKTALYLILSLKKLGFRIALDDYGSFNSNLFRLCTTPCDFLKVDIKITELLNSNLHRSRTLTILKGIKNLHREFGFEVIIEGVETSIQHQIITDHELGLTQGYFYSKPIPMSLITSSNLHFESAQIRA
jgi:EAL domain-containing protein (putative c-di-GMP-specific phosphodiesterase class I)